MIIYPTIELLGGRCVSLRRGRLDDPQIWHVDPVQRARAFAEAGAEWLHVTDFDAVSGDPRNRELILEIIRQAGIPLQLAGGFRSRERIEEWLDLGAGRVVVATLAAYDPASVKAVAKYHPDQIVLAVDVWRGHVMIKGWTTESAFTPKDFIRAYEDDPLAAVLITDVDNDIEATDGSLGVISGLADLARAPVIASGLVHGLDDIARLKYVRNVAGAIVGRALHARTFTIEEALAEARPEAGQQVAEFI